MVWKGLGTQSPHSYPIFWRLAVEKIGWLRAVWQSIKLQHGPTRQTPHAAVFVELPAAPGVCVQKHPALAGEFLSQITKGLPKTPSKALSLKLGRHDKELYPNGILGSNVSLCEDALNMRVTEKPSGQKLTALLIGCGAMPGFFGRIAERLPGCTFAKGGVAGNGASQIPRDVVVRLENKAMG